MKFKSLLFTFSLASFLLFSTTTEAYTIEPSVKTAKVLENEAIQNNVLVQELMEMTVAEFLAATPKSLKEKTGEKLKVKEILALKAAQKQLRKAVKKDPPTEDDKVLILVLCFFIPPVAVYMCYDSGKVFVTNIILTLLCGLPGVIHALVVCTRYFNENK